MLYSILSALIPVFCVVLLGTGLRRARLFAEDFWTGMERITYFLLLPLYFFEKISLAPLHDMAITSAALVCVAATCAVALLLFLSKRWIRTSGPSFSSVFQGGVRFNNYIGTSVAALLFGPDGVVYIAILIAVMVPLVNVLSVLVLTRYGDHPTPMDWGKTAYKLATNPLIIGCMGGLLNNFLGGTFPPFAGDAVHILSQAALPLGLLSVGAGMQRGSFSLGRPVIAGVLAKLLLLPLIAFALCRYFGVTGLEAQIALLMSCLPGATSSYILARQLGGDAALAALLLSFQTALAMITMPLMLWLSHLLQ